MKDDAPAAGEVCKMFKRLLVTALTVSQLAIPALSASVDNSQPDALNKLEQRFFSHTFKDETVGERLTRLEKLVFGAAGSGADDARVKKLEDSVSAADAAIQDAATSRFADAPSQSSGTGEGAQDAAGSRGSAGTTDEAGTAAPVDAGTDYPAVDVLERKIIGQVNTERPLRARLAEMERKAFGRVSSDPDLSNRVTALQKFAGGEISTGGTRRRPASSGIVPFTDDDGMQSDEDFAFSGAGRMPGGGGLLGDDGIAQGSTSQGDIVPKGVATRVSGMERQMFGKASHEPLPERLTKLEDAVFGNDPDRHNGSVIERTLKLSQAIDGARAASGMPQSKLYGAGVQQNESFPLPDVTNLPDPNTLGGAASPTTGGYNGSTNGGTAGGTGKGHAFLHGLGKALGMAGIGAAALLGSIGTGMSYGGYGMGMPYGGYGSYGMYSPYGSMYSPYGSSYGMGMGYSPWSGYGRGLGGVGFGGMGLGGMGMGGLGGMGIGGYGMGMPMFGF